MDIAILEDVGLSKRESKVYLALLELGSSTIGPIVKKSKVPSSKIYEILDKLAEKGFVSHIIIKHQKHFQAAEPEKLVDYVNEKKVAIEKALPELKLKQQLGKDRQTVELYEGRQAVFSFFFNLIKTSKKGENYYSLSLGDEHDDPEIAKFYQKLYILRKERGLKVKVLSNEKARKIYKKRYSKEMLEFVNNRFTTFNYPQGFVIFRNKLIILRITENPTAVVITSKDLTDQHTKFFHELYKNAKP